MTAFNPDKNKGPVGRLHLMLGDQLDVESPLLKELDPASDMVLMMEVTQESRHVRTHHQRTVFFLSAMRHAALALVKKGFRVDYVTLDDPENRGSLDAELIRAVQRLKPSCISVARPGSWRVLNLLTQAAEDAGHELSVQEDPHFLLTPERFQTWSDGRKILQMGHFYQFMRREMDVLLDEDGGPIDGKWSFDAENRNAFKAPPEPPKPWSTRTDAITREVAEVVERVLPDLPGARSMPGWPVTRRQALAQLRHFTKHALKEYGRWQDAMWTGENFLWHAHLAPAMNIKLIDPREVIQAAVDAWEQGEIPIESAEGFIRQVLGWREFIHGIYWTQDEDYRDGNTLSADRTLPESYWTGMTDMVCISESVSPVLEHAYSHHIQRLMITGTFAMMAGIDPRHVRDWYLGMFADGIDWVTTPNVIGMSQWADGGVVGSKPYAAGGRYIHRMSNYCKSCRFDPAQTTGPEACPMSTLFWSFLDRNQERFRSNHRMGMMLRNLDRQEPERLKAITLEGKRMLGALDQADLGSKPN